MRREKTDDCLYVVTYANGRTAYLVARDPEAHHRNGLPVEPLAVAVDGQKRGLIPLGQITAIKRAH
jgi:hypothetical protein